jgi:hypothetical protein
MKSAFVTNTLPTIRHHTVDTGALVQHADETEMLREAVEAQIAAARRQPAFAWIGVLAVVAPWGVAALVWAVMRAS